MRLKALMKTLTPLGWGVMMLVVLALCLAMTRGLGLSWDPFGLKAHRLERAEIAARRGQAEGLARQLEAAGQAEQLRRIEAAQGRLKQVAVVTAQTQAEARRAPDADIPLDQTRLDRLRLHDRQLCAHAPNLGGCATSTAPASGGPASL